MKTFVMISSFIVCTSLNAQKGNLYLSKWHNNEENKVYDYQYFEKGKLNYYLSNDNDNIYLDMKIEDSGEQNKILKQGLTIWINMDGKNGKKLGVRYPIGAQTPKGPNMRNTPDNNANASGNPNSPLTQANTIELIGFTNEESRRFPSDNSDNFRGSVKYDADGNLYYKMVMPIVKLPVRNDQGGTGAMPFTLGIEVGALAPVGARPQGGGGPPQGASDIPSGRRGGGGSRGGGRSGGGQGASRMSSSTPAVQPGVQPVVLWIKKIKLAANK